MNMLRQALTLWKTEGRHKGTTLQRRLILFFICVTASLILLFTLLLLMFGINGKEEASVERYLTGELEHIDVMRQLHSLCLRMGADRSHRQGMHLPVAVPSRHRSW